MECAVLCTVVFDIFGHRDGVRFMAGIAQSHGVKDPVSLLIDIQRRIMEEKQLPDFGMPIRRVSYLDGCKVYFDGGWIIVRFSGTEPRVRIFAERDTRRHADDLVRVMADFVGLPF